MWAIYLSLGLLGPLGPPLGSTPPLVDKEFPIDIVSAIRNEASKVTSLPQQRVPAVCMFGDHSICDVGGTGPGPHLSSRYDALRYDTYIVPTTSYTTYCTVSYLRYTTTAIATLPYLPLPMSHGRMWCGCNSALKYQCFTFSFPPEPCPLSTPYPRGLSLT
ncbi:hypothetical protein F4677DRAFT_402721 [Hypoxylon crocopeplum]|nr:hypothetical protein F4677DRAFT_402721 [Hypoxylon crocopeplum]